jgi:transposase InsO family protein
MGQKETATTNKELGAKVRASFLPSDRTYGARRVWRDLLADGLSCGLHRIERLMPLQALKARPRRRRPPPDLGERQAGAVAANVAFDAVPKAASQSVAVGVDTKSNNFIFDSASQTSPLRMLSAIASVASA